MQASDLVSVTNGVWNASSAVRQWVGVGVDTMHLDLPPLDTPEAALGAAALSVLVLLVCAASVVRVVGMVVAGRRARSNALLVRIAEFAPEDDGDEHELEKHNASRAPAPGDSDHEDDTPGGSVRLSKARNGRNKV